MTTAREAGRFVITFLIGVLFGGWLVWDTRRLRSWRFLGWVFIGVLLVVVCGACLRGGLQWLPTLL